MRTKTKLLVGVVVVPVLFAVLAATTMGGSAEFVSPTDVETAGQDAYTGERVNLEGVVTNLSQSNDRLAFTVTDANASVPVVYEGPMPETMAEGRVVVAKGYYNGSGVEANSLSVRAHEGERPDASGHHNGSAGNVTGHPEGINVSAHHNNSTADLAAATSGVVADAAPPARYRHGAA